MTVLPHRRYRAGRTTTQMFGCPTGPDDVDHAEWLHRLRGEQCTGAVGRSGRGQPGRRPRRSYKDDHRPCPENLPDL